MKKLKKVFAVLLSVAMILGMSGTVFAATATNKAPTPGDKALGSVSKVEAGSTVYAYRIVKPNYVDPTGKAVKGYVAVDGVSVKEPKAPTSEEVTAIATNSELLASLEKVELKATKADSTTYAEQLTPGYWVVLVTGPSESKKIYNPMLIGVYYSVSGTDSALAGGTVDATTNWMLVTENAYAKSSEPTIDKTVDATTDETIETEPNKSQETAGIGDLVTYNAKPQVPSYPDNAINKTFGISDRMDAGLHFLYNTLTLQITKGEGETADSVTVEKDGNTFKIGNAVVATAAQPTENEKAVNGFNLVFKYKELLEATGVPAGGVAGLHITVTYQAVITEDAVVGKDGNNNTVTLYYTNHPNDGKTWDNPNENPGEANEVVTKEDKEKVYAYQLAFRKTDAENKEIGLGGAIFGIYKTEADAKADKNCIDRVTTDEDGYAVSSQVAAGTYWVKELVAPEGYSLNDTPYPVEAIWTKVSSTVSNATITRSYSTEKPEVPEGADDPQPVGWILNDVFYRTDPGNGAQKAYLVTTTTAADSETTVTLNPDAGAGAGTALVNNGDIPNTNLASLPSTGGIGTIIFTVGGCLIMVAAAALYFANRRKAANSESK